MLCSRKQKLNDSGTRNYFSFFHNGKISDNTYKKQRTNNC